MWFVVAAALSNCAGRSAMLAIVMSSGLGSRWLGASFLVYGWWAQAVAWSGPYLSKSEHPGSVVPMHSRALMNGLGRIGERAVFASEPIGAVSPIRITSLAWPVLSSARWPKK